MLIPGLVCLFYDLDITFLKLWFIYSFLLKHKGLALPLSQINLEAFTWTDGEAVTKFSAFCGAVVLLAVSSSNVELRGFVAKDLFSAIIQGLALESNAFVSADLVGLCREIFVYLSDRDPSPRQVSCSPTMLKCVCLKFYTSASGVQLDLINVTQIIDD